jgi:hypothetical protein
VGYGPTPHLTLSWTQFYYVWFQSQLDQLRHLQAQRAWDLYTAALAAGNTKASDLLTQQETAHQAAEAKAYREMYAVLPPSVQALVDPPVASGDAGIDAWYADLIASYPENSPHRAFYRAGWQASRRARGLPENADA